MIDDQTARPRRGRAGAQASELLRRRGAARLSAADEARSVHSAATGMMLRGWRSITITSRTLEIAGLRRRGAARLRRRYP